MLVNWDQLSRRYMLPSYGYVCNRAHGDKHANATLTLRVRTNITILNNIVVPPRLDHFLFQRVINPDCDLNCAGMQIPTGRFFSAPNMSSLEMVLKADGTPRRECLSSRKHQVPQTLRSDSPLLSNYSDIP